MMRNLRLVLTLNIIRLVDSVHKKITKIKREDLKNKKIIGQIKDQCD